MNCEKCRALISDLLDGTLDEREQMALNLHLEECLSCAELRSDLESIVLFCRNHRGEYAAPPDEKALWLRIHNIIEAEQQAAAVSAKARTKVATKSWSGWLSRSWQVSLPQMVSSVAALVVLVSLATIVGVRRWENSNTTNQTAVAAPPATSNPTSRAQDRMWLQQQTINYWNQRVEMNKARWNPEMREAFDRNLKVIDQAVNDSLNELQHNPHDEISEEMLNAALHEKLSLLREFAEL